MAGTPRRHSVASLVAAARRVVVMADTCTMVAHLVTDEAMAAGRQAGRYVGACGAVVLPGSLAEDTDRFCRFCRSVTGGAASVTDRQVLSRRVWVARHGG